MTMPRKSLICLENTPYYHCISRCVRQAFLCGVDKFSGRSYDHRRGWVEKRLHQLADVFAIDLCAYAVMSNHTHVVLRVNSQQAKHLSFQEVIKRWHTLFAGSALSQRYSTGTVLGNAEQKILHRQVNIWRERLSSISWFMRCLNEPIARMANAEDGCRGRFWEGRFKCQALLDEAALIACMAYVDLNPVRAGIAKTPEESEHTSVKQRIQSLKTAGQPKELLPLTGHNLKTSPGLPLYPEDYLSLLDWTGRCLRDDKPGAIPMHLPHILERLQIRSDAWIYMNRHFESRFKHMAGQALNIRAACRTIGQQWAHGISSGQRLLSL